MSRELPHHANIDHLRKQAKERLRELQKSDPQAKLTDAQHDIAREYGFGSWPKLRAHVESLRRQLEPAPAVASPPSGGGGRARVAVGAADPDNYRFERYTSKAKQALFFSRHEAGQSGSTKIEPEHVLLGLIRAGQSVKSRLFERSGLSLVDARAEVTPGTGRREPLPSSVEIPFSDSTKLVLQAAKEEADRLVHDSVGMAHVLLGILRQPACVAASVLMGRGVDLQAVRQDIAARLHELQKSDPQAKLTDAQHDIAREYGFGSWPKLRARRFERYTSKAKQALFFSRHEAGQCGSTKIEPEHLLLGLIRARQSVKSRLFERAGLSLVDARAEVTPGTGRREPLPSSVEIPFSDSTKLVLQAAKEEADRLVHDSVGMAHVLVGILRQPKCVAASVLMGRGVDLQTVRQDIAALLNEEQS